MRNKATSKAASLRLPTVKVRATLCKVALTTLHQSVDTQTGRVVMRAEVDNTNAELLPGQFVRVELALQAFDDVVLIDPTTVSQGPDGPQVYVVNGTEQAQARPSNIGTESQWQASCT